VTAKIKFIFNVKTLQQGMQAEKAAGRLPGLHASLQ